jgi:hypothetical protein
MIPREMVRCTPAHLAYLATNLVEDDVRQFLAFTESNTYVPTAVVAFIDERTAQNFRFAIINPKTKLPAAAFGGYTTRPGVMQSWMLSSPEGWRSCWRAITKGSRWLMDQVFAHGIQSVETYVMADRDVTRRWYEKGLHMRLLNIEDGIALYSRGSQSCA